MPGYKIVKTVSQDDIPDWERRPAKWSELVDAVLEMKPGQVLMVEFESRTEAERARNAVRDATNLKAKAVIVRTRLVEHDQNEGATVYLERTQPIIPG